MLATSRRATCSSFHTAQAERLAPGSDVPFFDDVAAAIAKANGAPARGSSPWRRRRRGQALALGLVDEVAIDVVPVVFGKGKRYFGPIDRQHLEDPDVVIRGDRVLHLRCRARR